MRSSHPPTWARLRVYIGLFVLGLFLLGGLLVYASSLADPTSGRGGAEFRTLGLEVMIVAVIAVAVAHTLKDRLSVD